MLTIFAGPIFGPEDTPGLLLFLAIISLPFVFLAVGVVLLIRDAIKKRVQRSTVLYLGIGQFLFLVFKMASGII